MLFRIRTIMPLAVLVLVLAASAAHAAGWSAPVDGCTVMLAFGDRYGGVTHRGVDLAAPPGAEVRTPALGTVTFAGWVPADGGGTCGAVTVDIGGGLRVSLLPLGAVFVTAGNALEAGEVVGLLAASGDDSSAAPHLHLGLRQGDTYIDPGPYLPGVPGVTAPEPAPVSAPIESAPALPAPAVTAAAPTGVGVFAGTAVSGAAPAGLGVSEGSGVSVIRLPATPVSVQAPSSEGVTLAGVAVTAPSLTPHAVPVGADLPVPSALRPPGGRIVSGARALAGSLPLTGTTGVAAVLAMAGVLAAGRRRPVQVKA